MTITDSELGYDVHPVVGAYTVTEIGQQGGSRAFVVGKDKSCTCGGNGNSQCRHVKAVTEHLRRGGERAAEKQAGATPVSPSPSSPMVCPVCGAVVQGDHTFWRCSEDSSHYWQWRGERSGVKDFLTKPHPAKRGPFYEQTHEERAAFLAAAQRRHAVYAALAG